MAIVFILVAIALLWWFWLFHQYIKRKLPGPFLGALSPIRHLYFAHRGDLHVDVFNLHRCHGMNVQ